MKKVFSPRSLLLLLFILLIGAFLRFWNFPIRYGFNIDATRDAIIAQYAVDHHVLPLT